MNYCGFIVEDIGMESRCFVDSLGSKDFYWVEYAKSVDVGTQSAIQNGMSKISDVSRAVAVEVAGRKKHGGGFGHLKQYDKCIVVDRVISLGAEETKK